MIKADWPLKAGTADDALLAGTELQDKIKAAKLFGPVASDAPKTEAEEEQEGMVIPSGNEGPRPGEPSFTYVAKITEGDRAKAAAEAFKKASADAACLAKAAGVEIGALRQLMSSPVMGDGGGLFGGGYYESYRASSFQSFFTAYARRRMMDDSGDTEASSTAPGDLSYRVTVVASFGIK